MDVFTIDIDLDFMTNKLSGCIYCNGNLPAKNLEHIFNSSWGGTHKTGQIICDTCNSEYGANIDTSFKVYTKYIMNAWEFKGQRHAEVPTIETVEGFTIERGGKPKRKSEVNITKNEDGGFRIQANVGSKGEARKLLIKQKDEIEKEIGHELTEEEIENMHHLIRNSESVKEQVGRLEVKEEIRIQDEYRSATHTLIKCLALYDPQTAISGPLKAARDFAHKDVGNWRDFAIEAKPLISVLDQFNSIDVKYNAVEIYYSKSYGKIFGCLTILGRVKRWVVLSHKYNGPDQILCVREPMNRGTKLQSNKISFNESFPIINTDFKQPTMEQLFGQLAKIINDSISIDAPYAQFQNESNKLYEKYTIINDDSLKEFTECIATYLGTLAVYFEVKLNAEEIKQLIWDRGFTDLLENYNMRSLNDVEIGKKMANILTSLMDFIINKADKKPGNHSK